MTAPVLDGYLPGKGQNPYLSFCAEKQRKTPINLPMVSPYQVITFCHATEVKSDPGAGQLVFKS